MSVARRSVHHLVNLVYRPTSPEGTSKDDEFSRRSIEERWRAGHHDTVQALRHPGVLERAAGRHAGIFISISLAMAVETWGGSTAYVFCTCAACAKANSLARDPQRQSNGSRAEDWC
jgi:hypothetical protein